MKTAPIIEHLRRWSPTFGARVAGGLSFDIVRDTAQQPMPAAYVIPTEDDPGENQLQNGTRQDIRDEFDVVVQIPPQDARGQAAGDVLHDIRAELLRALVGWVPMPGYDPITYVGGGLLVVDRSRVMYRFTFAAGWSLGGGDTPETWEELEQAGFPAFTGVDIRIDAVDPMADPNLSKPGPDGRIENELRIEFTQPDQR